MSRYNLTIARPAGFLHSSAFIEVRDSLGWALAELGHEANCSENLLSVNAVNILFGAETMTGAEWAWSDVPRDALIIYNLEQPSHPKMDVVRKLAQGHQVWDFSQRNVEAWKSAGYDVRWLPVAYTPHLTRIPPSAEQPIDVLFYGWLTPRRVKMKERLEQAGHKCVFTDNCYGGSRDYLISRSKIVLNLHHDGRTMTEIVRLSYLLANQKTVISEESTDDADYKHLGLSLWSYESLPHAIMMALANPSLRRRLASTGFQKFSKDRLVEHLERALR